MSAWRWLVGLLATVALSGEARQTMGQTTSPRAVGTRLIADAGLVARPVGAGQTLLPDLTSLTVSDDGEVVLDRYEYDPASGAGIIEIMVTHGVLRLIGGQIPRTADATIRTPAATIYVRGGMMAIIVEPGGRMTAMHVAGAYTRVEAAGESVTLARANAMATVEPGAAPVFAGIGREADVAATYRGTTFALAGGGTRDLGGETASVILARAEQAPGLGDQEEIRTNPDEPELTEAARGGSLAIAVETEGEGTDSGTRQDFPPLTAEVSFLPPTGGPGFVAMSTGFTVSVSGSDLALSISGERTFGATPVERLFLLADRGDNPSLAPADAGFTQVRDYELSGDILTGAAAFARFDALGFFPDDRAETASGLTLVDAAGANAKAVSGVLRIVGEGTAQSSGFGVFTGPVRLGSKGELIVAGAFEGSVSQGAAGPIRVSAAAGPVADASGATAFGRDANVLVLSTSALPGRHIQADGTVDRFATTSIAALTSISTVPQVARATLPAARLSGFAASGGIDTGSGSAYVARSAGVDGLRLTTDLATNSAFASIALDTFSGEDGGPLRRLVANFDGRNGRSAVVNDRLFALRGAVGGGFAGAMASADLVGDGGVFPDGASTAPAFLSWGWWAGEAPAGAVSGCADCATLDGVQRLHLGVWIGGDATRPTDLPSSGVATYEGFAVVSAVKNDVGFVDGAGFRMNWDFGRSSGAAQFTDLLGTDATVAVRRGGPSMFTGSGDIRIDGRMGRITLDGGFFNGPNSDPARATAGSLGVRTNDASINAAGVFGGGLTELSSQ